MWLKPPIAYCGFPYSSGFAARKGRIKMLGSSIQAFGQQVMMSKPLNPCLEVHRHHQRQSISIVQTFGRITRCHCSTTELFVVAHDGLVQPMNRLVVSHDELSVFSSFFKVLDNLVVQKLSENIVLTNKNSISVNIFIVINDILPQQVRVFIVSHDKMSIGMNFSLYTTIILLNAMNACSP